MLYLDRGKVSRRVELVKTLSLRLLTLFLTTTGDEDG
jgi:hypothetical protein